MMETTNLSTWTFVNTSNASYTEEPFSPSKQDIVTSLFLGGMALGSFIGNTLVILSVATNKRLRTVTNCFVVSLAIADCLVSVLVLPLNIKVQLTGSWKLGVILCDLWISLDVMLCTASILNLCCISLDRYFAITKPLMYATKRSKRLALIMIANVWLLSVIITCPPIFGWMEEGRHLNDHDCYLIRNPGYIIYSAMGSFFLPFLVMTFVYARIFKVAREREKRLKPYRRSFVNRRTVYTHIDGSKIEGNNGTEDETNVDSNSNEDKSIVMTNYGIRDTIGQSVKITFTVANTHRKSITEPTKPTEKSVDSLARKENKKKERAVLQSERKTAKTLAVVVGCFIICWFPFFVMYLVEGLCIFCQIDPILSLTLTWLGYANSGLNPFIYAFYNDQFRKSFWELTCGLFRNERRKSSIS